MGSPNAVFTWQWIANDGTADARTFRVRRRAGYTLTSAEAGKTIKVRVDLHGRRRDGGDPAQRRGGGGGGGPSRGRDRGSFVDDDRRTRGEVHTHTHWRGDV